MAEIELTSGSDPLTNDLVSENPQLFTLPQADSGKEAWLVLLGSFTIEALLWGMYSVTLSEPSYLLLSDCAPGFLFSFGVFQEYYSTNEPFVSEASSVAQIGTFATVLGLCPIAF